MHVKVSAFFDHLCSWLYSKYDNTLVSYPIPESVSSNITCSLALVFMFLFTLITDALRAGPDADPPNNMRLSMIVSAVIICVGSIPCIWLNGDLKRIRVDKEALF